MENVIEDHRKQWLLLVVVALALFLDGLDGTIVNVVLPDIAEDMSIGLGTTSWVVTVYFLVMAGLILVIGKIADSGNRPAHSSEGKTCNDITARKNFNDEKQQGRYHPDIPYVHN